MSQENVEIVRRAYEAADRGDLDAVIADAAPELEYIASGAVPGRAGVFRGAEGLKRFMSWFWEEFDDTRVEVRELIDGGEQVVAAVQSRGRGKQSGVETSLDVWQVWTLRDSKVVRGQGFATRMEALEAAGLSE